MIEDRERRHSSPVLNVFLIFFLVMVFLGLIQVITAQPTGAQGAIIQPGLPQTGLDPPVQPETAQIVSADPTSVYVVKQGDTLSKIATSFGITVQDLLVLNPQIQNPSLIFPGQQIVISTETLPVTGDPGNVYIVVRGDTVGLIAARYNTSVEAILAANPQIENRDLIFPGQDLVIP